MKFFITMLFLSCICYVSMVEDEKISDTKDKSGFMSNHDHEGSKKGEEIKENKKIDYSDELYKKTDYEKHKARTKTEAHHEKKRGDNRKKKSRRKKTGFRKGFHDKYHFDEEKKGKKFWGSTNSHGKYTAYKKKSKNNKKREQIDKLKNGIKIERNYPGGRFVEITWRN